MELARPGIELLHPTLGVHSLNHWPIREVQENLTLLINNKQGNNCPQEGYVCCMLNVQKSFNTCCDQRVDT